MSPQPYVFPEFASPQLKVVQDYFKYISALDIDNLGTLMADDFHQKTAPLSLGVPDKTKAQDLAFLEELKVVLNGQHLHYTFYEVNDSPRKTWVHAKLDTLDIETIFLFQFGEGHHADKVVSLTDFADSKRYLELQPPEEPINPQSQEDKVPSSGNL